MSRGTDEGIVVKPAPGMGGGLSGIIGSRREKSDGPLDMAAMAAMAARGGGMGMNGSARGSGTPARPSMLTDAGFSSAFSRRSLRSLRFFFVRAVFWSFHRSLVRCSVDSC